MAEATGKGRCVICEKEKSAVRCEGCLQIFCRIHLNDHSQQLSKELDEIEMSRDLFRQTINEQRNDPQKHSFIKRIEQWEFNSIKIIQITAKECKEKLLEHTDEHFQQVEINFDKLTNQLRETRQENDFNEMDLNKLKKKLSELEERLDQMPNVSIQEESTSFIGKISVVVGRSTVQLTTSPFSSSVINKKTKWKQDGMTIVGGNGTGNQLNKLTRPQGIDIDDDHQCIYVTDYGNARIMEWKFGAKMGKVVAGGNGEGNRMDQLNGPTAVLVDRKTDSLIICDWENGRVVRWPRRNGREGQTLISGITCGGLAMDNNGDLYLSDCEKQEVRRWKFGEKKGTVVAGGNGKGDQLNQLNGPSSLFVDEDGSVYVSDNLNHRVIKWVKDGNEGILVAGGQGRGNSLTQLSLPQGMIVDHLGRVYVADYGNNRIVRWSKGSKEGHVVLGGNGAGQQPNQFNGPRGLSIDREGNLYVADSWHHRIQRFEIDYR